jgi:hypothetical protein
VGVAVASWENQSCIVGKKLKYAPQRRLCRSVKGWRADAAVVPKKIVGLCALSTELVSNNLKQPGSRYALQKHKMLRCNKPSFQYI